jgi:hypothetical protein
LLAHGYIKVKQNLELLGRVNNGLLKMLHYSMPF